MNQAYILSTMTLAQFKAFKKALSCLIGSGMNRDNAIQILTDSFADRFNREKEYRHSHHVASISK